MVRTHKFSKWQPSSWNFTEKTLKRVKVLYPNSVVKAIIAAAQLHQLEHDITKRKELEKKLEKQIIGLGCWTIQWKNLSSRPSPAQRKAALTKVATATHKLNALLSALDGDSADLLRIAIRAQSEKSDGLATNSDESSPFYSYEKYQNLLAVVDRLAHCAEKAKEQALVTKDGDLPADVKQWYAEELIKIWLGLGYKKPTVSWDVDESKTKGALLTFATAAAAPLGLNPMEAAIRKEIVKGRSAGQ